MILIVKDLILWVAVVVEDDLKVNKDYLDKYRLKLKESQLAKTSWLSFLFSKIILDNLD